MKTMENTGVSFSFRWYQDEAISAFPAYFAAGNVGNPLFGMPTGTGKSYVIGMTLKNALCAYPQTRALMLTHVNELIEQNAEELEKLWRNAPYGINSASAGKREYAQPIIYAGPKSIKKNLDKLGHRDFALVDECHLVSNNDDSDYREIFSHFKKRNPYFKVAGYSATMWRQNNGHLVNDTLDKDGNPLGKNLFTDVAYDLTSTENFNRLLREGFLVPVVPIGTQTQIDVSSVGIIGGDYNQSQLQDAVDRDEITYAALQEACHYGQSRHAWVIFAAGNEHSEHICTKLNQMGVKTTYVHSGVAKAERKQRIAAYKAGQYRAIVSNNILTTGFNHPAADLIVMLRHTRSVALWVQMLGRGTRPVYIPGFDLNTVEGRLQSIAYSQKQNCLVLDFAANSERLGYINAPNIPKQKGKPGTGEMPVKICPTCRGYNFASARFCEFCNHEFKFEVKIAQGASTNELIKPDDDQKPPKIVTFNVQHVTYEKHQKVGSLPVLKVTIYSGTQRFRDWVCIEHSGRARQKAEDWWRIRTNGPAPYTIEDALAQQNTLREPKRVTVDLAPEYPTIMGYEYD